MFKAGDAFCSGSNRDFGVDDLQRAFVAAANGHIRIRINLGVLDRQRLYGTVRGSAEIDRRIVRAAAIAHQAQVCVGDRRIGVIAVDHVVVIARQRALIGAVGFDRQTVDTVFNNDAVAVVAALDGELVGGRVVRKLTVAQNVVLVGVGDLDAADDQIVACRKDRYHRQQRQNQYDRQKNG